MKFLKIAQEWRENPSTGERKLVPVAVNSEGEAIRLVQDWDKVLEIVSHIGGAEALSNIQTFKKEYDERTIVLAKIGEYEGDVITAATKAATPAAVKAPPAEKPKRGTK
jgi:hypothetical protein